MEKTKRILSVLLVAVMMLTIMPLGGVELKASAWGNTFGNPVENLPTTITCAYQGYSGHNGFDLGVSSGTALYSMFSGTATFIQAYVTSTKKSGSYGNYVSVTSDDGKYTALYCHLTSFNGVSLNSSINSCQNYGSSASSVSISKDTRGSKHVNAGELLGYSGSTGNSSGPHCHIELKINGAYVNPADYISNSYSAKSNVNGSSFDFIYSIDLGVTDGATIDKTKTPTVKIDGWCFGSNGSEADVYYSVDSAADYICNKYDRQDVRKIHGNAPTRCGFSAEIPIKNFSNGQHRISIWCKSGSNIKEMSVSYITVTSSYSDPVVTRVYWGGNGGNTSCRPVVDIANPETVDHVSFPMWSHNGDGKQNNLNWYESVFNGESCWFNDIPFNNFSYQILECHCYVYGKNGSRKCVVLPITYNRNFTYSLDVNTVIDGSTYYTGNAGFTYDVYIDGNRAANDVTDWAEGHFCGQTYEIKDIKCPVGYSCTSGNLSGQMLSNKSVNVTFVKNSSTLKVNPNGGSWNGSTSVQSFTQKYNTTKDIPVPTRSGYTFTGWTRTNSYGSLSSTTAAAKYTFGSANNVTDTLTANWKQNHTHSYTSKITKEATCTADGVKTFTCSCGNSYTEVVKATGHKEVIYSEMLPPTCTANGHTPETRCQNCAITMTESKVIPMIEHADNNNDGKCDMCKKDLGTHNPSDNCSHMCHQGGFAGFIWKILNLFNRIFGTNKVCECGAMHY